MDRNCRSGTNRWGYALAEPAYIVIPLLIHIRLSAFFAIVGSLQLFDSDHAADARGPADSSHTMVSFLYTFA